MEGLMVNVPNDQEELKQMIDSAKASLKDSNIVHHKSVTEIEKIAESLSEIKTGYDSSYLEVINKSVKRELGIFQIFSHFTVEDAYYKAKFWSPVASERNIENQINDLNPKLTYKLNMMKEHTGYKPPTNIQTNDLLDVF